MAGFAPTRFARPADGYDGTWVAHPGLVPIAIQEFVAEMAAANQLDRLRDDVHVTAADLLTVRSGPITKRAFDQHQRRPSLPGELAPRGRLRPHLQPDGRRRHVRDFATRTRSGSVIPRACSTTAARSPSSSSAP